MRTLRFMAISWIALSAAAGPGFARSPDAATILRKAEAVRNPEMDYAVDFTIHGISQGSTRTERDASYSMIAGGKDRTVILMRSPTAFYGGLVSMADDRYWMLLPKSSKAWELSIAQIQAGDVATGDIARTNFTRAYAAALDGEEEVEGVRCWRLSLTRDDATRYARVLYWVAKKSFLPTKLEQYGRTGTRLRTVRYLDFQKGPLGLRPMTLTIESHEGWKESCTLTFTNLRRIDPPPNAFTPEGMEALRDAALAVKAADGRVDAPLEEMLRVNPEP